MSGNDFHYFLDRLKEHLSTRVPGFDDQGLHAFVEHFFEENADQLDTEGELEEMKPVMIELIEFMQHRPANEHKLAFLSNILSERGEFPVLAMMDNNRPFIVESVQMQLERRGIVPMYRYATLYAVTRDSQGHLQQIAPYTSQSIPDQAVVESLLTFHLPTTISESQQEAIRDLSNSTFTDIRMVSDDWPLMIEQARQCAEALRKFAPDTPESSPRIADFLQLLIDDHFTFLASEEYVYSARPGSGTWRTLQRQSGLLRHSHHDLFGRSTAAFFAQSLQDFAENSDVCYKIVKSRIPSPLRRDMHLDVLIVKRYDDNGHCFGDVVFAGLFAWAMLTEPLKNIPMLAERVDSTLVRFDAREKSHSGQQQAMTVKYDQWFGTKEKSYAGRQLIHLCESYPREQILQINPTQFYLHIQRMRRIYRRREFGVLTFYEPLNHCITFTVYLPRTDYSASLREAMLHYFRESFEIDLLEFNVHLPNEPIWRVHFILFLGPEQAVPSASLLDEVEATLQQISLSSFERLRAELSKDHDMGYVSTMCQRYAEAFSPQYWRQNGIDSIAKDIAEFETMAQAGKAISAVLHCEEGQWQVRLYNRLEARIFLSDIMPMLERMGLRVLQEVPHRVNLGVPEGEADAYSLLIFDIEHAVLGDGIDAKIPQNFRDCMDALFDQNIEIDGFLALVINAGMAWRDINMLRAYAKYMRQIGAPYSLQFIGETLNLFPEITQHLVKLFYARFEPETASDTDEEQAIDNINTALEQVSVLDQDSALSLFKNLIRATLRTNYFQTDVEGGFKPAISLKLAPREIEIIPHPVPLREIFVYSADFEAVHLRFGMVSRGGLRWSDRTADFRTEILGLVKAQQVKNAVIVPMGSKGGFVLKRPQPDRQAFMDEGVRCYRQFISSMLDITDSYEQGQQVRKPLQVVCHDEDDPYLVVAADKGTATFSDFANDVSDQYGFWLGDAFASGGSVGYDHKKMGITARGAWESVKRHFREMNHNTQTTPFDVVGVGDMSGDVFGNGMLLSRHIRLVGAFNHLHIFIDPDPDPAVSYAERQRLFALPRSNWADYNKDLLSRGGAIFDRQAKSLDLTPEIRQRLGLSHSSIAPNDLVRALLTMPGDLLWFGGIGTYIKASSENNLDVGDKANDSIRINAHEVGAKVIGEGANLGMTQLARIEFAQHGGRCNTDAIDNSAGVNCSDTEVNIKILLGQAMNTGSLAEDDRVALLESMTEEVGELVLANNYQQTLSLSVTEASAPRLMSMHQRVMQHFERMGELDRALEGLPNEDEIDMRRKQSQGLTRPELSVLLAYGKNITYQTLLDSPFLDDPVLETYLIDYFPSTLQERFGPEILSHQLRRQIIATVVTNTVLNRSGVGFIVEMENLTGCAIDRVCAAYMTVVDIFNLGEVWKQVEALDNRVDPALQHEMLAETTVTIRRMTEWLLVNGDTSLSMQDTVILYRQGLYELSESLTTILSPQAMARVEERTSRFVADNVLEQLSQRVGRLKVLSTAFDIVELSQSTAQSVIDVATCYYALSDRFHLDRLRTMANNVNTNDHWTAQALSATIDDLWKIQSQIAQQVMLNYSPSDTGALTDDGQKGIAASKLEAWLAEHEQAIVPLDNLFNEFFQHGEVNVSMFNVLQRQLKMLIQEHENR